MKSKPKPSRIRKKGSKGKLQTHDSLGRVLGEKVTQNQILKWLEKEGYLHWRQNAGTLKGFGTFVRLGPKGIPDIIVVLPPGGMFVGLEVKSPNKYQNPDQKRWQARLEAVGGKYKVVRSLQEAKDFICKLTSQSTVLTAQMTGTSTLDHWS